MTAEELGRTGQMFRAARLLLLTRYPFYGSLMAHLRPRFVDTVPTAAVDSRDNLYINPQFFGSLPDVGKRAFVLAHEALHPALGIFFRGMGHDPNLSNIAHDFVINLILRDDNPDWLPAGALISPEFARMSYEEVYGKLAKRQQAGDRLPELLMADVLPAPLPGVAGGEFGTSEDGTGVHAQVWQARVVAAQLFATAQGRGSRGMDRAVAVAQGSTVRWEDKLRRAVHEAMGTARTDWTRPHRRSSALGFYLPREVRQGCDCVVYVDTSLSISGEHLGTATRETAAIVAACGGRIRWMQGDDGLLSDEWIQEAPLTLKGGGGTSFVPLFEHLRDGERLSCAVVFTDTFGEMPDFVPDFPVVWAVYGESESDLAGLAVPFGEMVWVPEHAFAQASRPISFLHDFPGKQRP
jgi:predicted metal-dependent peptidase